MKKFILFLFIVVFVGSAWKERAAFDSQGYNQILQPEGDCESLYKPESTFKIILSLIEFDFGVLKKEIHPLWSLHCGTLISVFVREITIQALGYEIGVYDIYGA